MSANPVSLTVFLFFFVLVACLGFFAKRWRKTDLHSLQEWGLAGRSFGIDNLLAKCLIPGLRHDGPVARAIALAS